MEMHNWWGKLKERKTIWKEGRVYQTIQSQWYFFLAIRCYTAAHSNERGTWACLLWYCALLSRALCAAQAFREASLGTASVNVSCVYESELFLLLNWNESKKKPYASSQISINRFNTKTHSRAQETIPPWAPLGRQLVLSLTLSSNSNVYSPYNPGRKK